MKKFLALVLALCIVFAVTACGSSSTNTATSTNTEAGSTTVTETSETTEKEVYRVLCSLRLVDDFSAWLKTAFETEAAKYDNIELTVVDNKQDADTWVTQLENAVTEGYDYFLNMPPDADCTELVKDAQAKGLKLINIEINVSWALGLFPEINVTDYDMAGLIANMAADKLPENANIVILNGIPGIQPTIDRRDTFQKLVLDVRPDITLLDEQTANFQKDQAMSITDDWIQKYGETIDGVLSANDTMALGAMESFKSNGIDVKNIQFYGIDGLADACAAIISGEYD